MKADEVEHGPCPLQWGDRIDHQKFGFGTVVGEPVPVMGGSLEGPPYVVPSGWRITVDWDDPARPQGEYSFDPARNNIFRKVSSPNARGQAYWANEWRKCLEPLLAARAATDAYLKEAFRRMPPFAPDTLAQLQERERQALADVESFLAADERGDHA